MIIWELSQPGSFVWIDVGPMVVSALSKLAGTEQNDLALHYLLNAVALAQ